MRYLLLSGISASSLIGCQVTHPAVSTDYRAVQQQLQHVNRQDQQIREAIMAVGMNSEAAVPLFRQMRVSDSVNQVYIRQLLLTSGWPKRSQIGEDAASTVFLVVQHSNRTFIAQQLPKLRKLARKGETQETNVALMEDRLLMFSGRKQRYGTQTANWLRSDGQLVVWPIRQPARVNQRRKRQGFLTTVEENAAQLGAQYHPDERLPSPRVMMQ